jgi:hypothetical protein
MIKSYDVFEVDYLPMALNKSSHSDHKADIHHNKRNDTEKTSSLKTLFVGNVPSLLTAETAKALIKPTYSWCKLEKSDYWLPDEENKDSKELSLSSLTTKFKRRNSKLTTESSATGLLKDFLFFPTHLETCDLSSAVSTKLLTKGFLILKGTIRSLSENSTTSVLPSSIINGIGAELISDLVCLVRLASTASSSSSTGKDTTVIQPVFLSCVDLAFVDYPSSPLDSTSSASPLFVGLEKDHQTIKLYELSSSSTPADTSYYTAGSHDNPMKGFIVCKRNITFDDVFFSKIWMNGELFLFFLLSLFSYFLLYCFLDSLVKVSGMCSWNNSSTIQLLSFSFPEFLTASHQQASSKSSSFSFESRAVSKHIISFAKCAEDLKILSFLCDENIREVVFQPCFSRQLKGEDSQPINELMDCMSAFYPSFSPMSSSCRLSLLAVLTTHRLLLINSQSLQIVSSVFHSCSSSLVKYNQCLMNSSQRFQQDFARGTDKMIYPLVDQRSFSNRVSSVSSKGKMNRVADDIFNMQFCGNSLAFILESGVIHFLVPFSSSSSSPKCQDDPFRSFDRKKPSSFEYRLIMKTLGLQSASYQLQSSSFPNLGKILSLPRNLSSSFPRSLRIVGMFPDRLMVMYADRLQSTSSFARFQNSSLFPCVTFRPWNPMEPLLAGLLTSFPAFSNSDNKGNYWIDIISAVIAYYSPVLASSSISSSSRHIHRIVPSQHLMFSLAFHWEVLSRGHFGKSVEVTHTRKRHNMSNVAGLLSNLLLLNSNRKENHHSSELFPLGRWIPPGIRSFWSLSNAPQPLSAAIELLLENHPSLADLLSSNESFGGNHLPLPRSVVSKRLTAFAYSFIEKKDGFCKNKNDLETMIRLVDVAGCYSLIFSFLTHGGHDGHDERGIEKIFDEYAMEVSHLSPNELQSLLKLGKKTMSTEEKYQVMEDYLKHNRLVSFSNLARSTRSKSLHSSLTLLVRSTGSKPYSVTTDSSSLSLFDEDVFKKSCLLYFQKFGGYGNGSAIGPLFLQDTNIFPVKYLALDLLEEFIGTQQQIETIEGSFSSFDSGGAGTAGTGEGIIARNNHFFKEQLASKGLPKMWSENIGYGRELDKVSAYYRFSDAVAYDSSSSSVSSNNGFICSNIPFTLLTFVDLSRYNEGQGIELFNDNNEKHSFTVDHTSSNVNTGDKHESTKLLCDIIHRYTTPSNLSSSTSSDLPLLPPPSAINNKQETLSPSSGLRLLVLRGSALDIGCYHYDNHRNQITIEFHLAFTNSKDTLKSIFDKMSSSSGLVLVERKATALSPSSFGANSEVSPIASYRHCLWKLFFDKSGSLCFSNGLFEEGKKSSSSSSSSSVVSSSFNLLKLFDQSVKTPTREGGGGGDEDEGEDNNEFTSFYHFVMTIDSSNSPCSCQSTTSDGKKIEGEAEFVLSYSQPIRVIVHVDGEKILDASTIILREVKESELVRSNVLFLPNWNLSYRFTELRIWSEIRSTQELNDYKENYLMLAEKRQRLQMQLKGTRKLFSAFKDIEVPRNVICDRLIDPAMTEEGESATTTKKGNPGMVDSKIGASSLFTSVIPPSSATAGFLSPSVTSATPSSAIASGGTGAGLTARQRRLSQLGAPTPASVGGGGLKSVGKPIPSSVEKSTSDSAIVPPVPSTLPSPPPSSAFDSGFAAFDSVPTIPSPPHNPPPVPPSSVSHDSVSTSDKPAVAKDNETSNNLQERHHPVQGIIEYSQPFEKSSSFRYDVLCASMNHRRTKLLSLPLFFGNICRVDKEGTLDGIFLEALLSGTSQQRPPSVNLESKQVRLLPVTDFQCYSSHDIVLISPKWKSIVSSGSSSSSMNCQITVYTNKALEVLEFPASLLLESSISSSPSSDVRKIVSIPLISTSLTYFYYLTNDLMILITSTDGFTWKPAAKPDGSGGRFDPIKILTRIDLKDSSFWKERTVLEVAISPERWTLLISCSNSHHERNFLKDYIVSLHHAKSGKAISFKAVGGVFKAPGQVLLLFHPLSTEGTNRWKLGLFDLNHLLDVISDSSFDRHPHNVSDVTNSSYQIPVEYEAINFDQAIVASSITFNESTNGATENQAVSKIIKGVWSIEFELEIEEEKKMSSLTKKAAHMLFQFERLVAHIYQINDKIFVLFDNGKLVLIGSGSSLKNYGQYFLFVDYLSSSAEHAKCKILSVVNDFSDLEDPILVALIANRNEKREELDDSSPSLRISRIHLKAVANEIKLQYKQKKTVSL